MVLVASQWIIPDPPIGLCNILTIQSHWQLTGHQFSIVSLKTLLVTTDPSSDTPKNHVTPLPSPSPPKKKEISSAHQLMSDWPLTVNHLLHGN